MLLEKRYRAAALSCTIAALIHNSSLVPAALLAMSTYLWSISFVRKRYLLVLCLALIVGYVTGFFISGLSIRTIENAIAKNDGTISTIVLIQDALLFLFSLLGVIWLGKTKGFFTKGSAVAVIYLAFLFGLLAGMQSVTLWVLRFYFYIEWFRVIGVITIAWFIVHRLKLDFLLIFIFLLTFIIFI